MAIRDYVGGVLKNSNGVVQFFVVDHAVEGVCLSKNDIGWGDVMALQTESQLWQFANMMGLEFNSYDQVAEQSVEQAILANHSYYRY